MAESHESDTAAVAIGRAAALSGHATFGEAVEWILAVGDDPTAALSSIDELDASDLRTLAAHLARLVHFALLKPAQVPDADYLRRVALLSQDFAYDPWTAPGSAVDQ